MSREETALDAWLKAPLITRYCLGATFVARLKRLLLLAPHLAG
jgi:hypothetical protein